MPPLSIREVLRYVRLEEGDGAADLLLPASLRYLGEHPTPAGACHYWSYPTAAGVGWAEFDAHGRLGLAQTVPPSVRDLTPARAEHKMRTVARQALAEPVARRTKPTRAVWVPLPELPGCDYHDAWVEPASFDEVLAHYGAKPIRSRSAGPGTRHFYIQLTSGRYACFESRRDFPQTVIISLEVDARGAGKHSGGKVYVCDIEEILRPMGGTFKMPSGNLYIGWSTDA